MVGYQGTPKYWLPGNPIELPGYLGGLTLLGLLSSQEQAVWVVLTHCNKMSIIGIKIYFGLAGRSFKLTFEHMR